MPSAIANTAIVFAQEAFNNKVCENPLNSNSGPEVNQYLASVGLKPGNEWCMSFAYWCFNEAAVQSGIQNPLYKTGLCYQQWQESPANQVQTPDVGDLLVFKDEPGEFCQLTAQARLNPKAAMDLMKMEHTFLLNTVHGHVGLVTEILAGNILSTIEGNTNWPGLPGGDSYVNTRQYNYKITCKDGYNSAGIHTGR